MNTLMTLLSPTFNTVDAILRWVARTWLRAFGRYTYEATEMRPAYSPLVVDPTYGEVTDVGQARLFRHAPAFIVSACARLALAWARAGAVVPVRLLFELGLSPNTFITIRNGVDVRDTSLNRSPGYFRVSLFHAIVLATRGEYMILKLCLCYRAHCSYIADYSINDFVYPHRVLWDLALIGDRAALYTAFLYSPYFATEPCQYGPLTNDPLSPLAYLRTRYYDGYEEGPHSAEIRAFLEEAMTANGRITSDEISYNHELYEKITPLAESLRDSTYPKAKSAADRYEALKGK